MTRINSFFLIEDEQKAAALKFVATEMVEKSINEHGCVAFDFFASTTRTDVYMMCETWRTEEDLKAHRHSDHYKNLVPKLQEIATMTTEVFDF